VIFIGVIAFYSLLGWYLDNVVPNNRGVPKHLLFFLDPCYWLPSVFGDQAQRFHAKKHQEVDNGINSEKDMILQLEKAGGKHEGVRCLGLSKTYLSLLGGHQTDALKNVYFQIGKGELLGVMGQNGAGKSTRINVLCGQVKHDGGNAKIYEGEIETRLQYCRKRMGVVS